MFNEKHLFVLVKVAVIFLTCVREHTVLEKILVFRAVHGVWLSQGFHLDPKYVGKAVLKIFLGSNPEIGTLGTRS